MSPFRKPRLPFSPGLIRAVVLASVAAFTARGATPTYERDIRPILKANCFHCHGEGGERKSGLDLRLRRLVLQGGKQGAAIVPGKRDDSRLFEFVRTGEMPPGKHKLAAGEVALIGQWITAGAPTLRPEPADLNPDHHLTEEERGFWAFQPIRRPAPPEVRAAEKIRTPVDAFLLARLEAERLTFSPAADRRTFIRRVTFDLTGLPPTPEEVAAFLKECETGNEERRTDGGASDSELHIPHSALERLVDRLLAAPRYGERWGRHWLDVAGYADSEGYAEADTERQSAHKYRDHVIQAFNADQPWDQFIREQLAGDELVDPPYKNLRPGQIEQLVATGFLRMAPDGTASGGLDQNVARNQVVADTLQITGTALLGLTVACAQCHDHRYDPISHEDYHRLRAIFEPALDWKNWRTPPARRISLYTDADRARAAEIETRAKELDAARQRKIGFFIDRTLEWKLKSMPAELREPLRRAYQTADKDRSEEQKSLLKANPSIRNISAGSLYLYDREYRVEISKLQHDRASRLKELLAAATARHPGTKIDERNLAGFDAAGAAALQEFAGQIQYYQDTLSEKVLKDMAEAAKQLRDTKPVEEFIRALTEVPGKVPDTFLFHRGDHEQPKQRVAPGELAVLAALKPVRLPVDDSSLPTSGRRLAYARHLTDGSHPLVARVLVNRFWAHHFGRGLVASLGDFGRLGERPSHPELLDWLAADFMAHGWRLKRLHKLILLSTAYRQSARRDPRLEELDPDNRLLGRMSLQRLDAETLRDSLLAVSGRLQQVMGGRPVPVMEDEVGQFVVGRENKDGEGKPGAVLSLNGHEHRRSIYVQQRRSRPLSVMETFDLPAMAPNCEVRNASTVASQSLLLMNSGFVADTMAAMAARVTREAGADRTAQVRRAWQLVYGDEPAAPELVSATGYLTRQAGAVKANLAKDDKSNPEQLALATLCQALVSANRFLYVD